MWWIITFLLVVASLIVGFVGGTLDVARQEYQIVLHFVLYWGGILFTVGLGAGPLVAIVFWVYIMPTKRKLKDYDDALTVREQDLQRREKALSESVLELKRPLLTDGMMVLIKLNNKERETQWGKQVTRIEQALREQYKVEFKKLSDRNTLLEALLKLYGARAGDMQTPIPISMVKAIRPKLVARPVKRKKAKPGDM